MADTEQILTLSDVRKRRGEDYSLHIRNFAVRKGEHVAILGPSGSGKSTTLDVIGMVLDMDSATAFHFAPQKELYDIAEIWKAGKQSLLTELRRKNMGYILQTGEIFDFLPVISNVELTALAAGLPAEVAKKRSLDLLKTLEIGHLAQAMPRTLSIGQRQRVAIARALAPQPALLLADEPTSALDPGMARKVMRLLLQAIKDFGTALVLVSHDHQLVSEFGFRKVEIGMQGNEAILDDQQ